MKLLGFDLEIMKELPNTAIQREELEALRADDAPPEIIKAAEEKLAHDSEWRNFAPLGITCAAVVGPLPTSYGRVFAPQEGFGVYLPKLSEIKCREIAHFIGSRFHSYEVVSWNGAGFDFPVLGQESDSMADAAQLCARHIDIGFQMVCEKGYMCGLNAAAVGMGLEGKMEGMSGDLAPTMWRQGRAEQEKVLKYVKSDAILTADVYLAIIEKGSLSWKTKAGHLTKRPWYPSLSVPSDEGRVIVQPHVSKQYPYLPTNPMWEQACESEGRRLLTVEEAMLLPLPNTSWMDASPRPREYYSGWIVEHRVTPAWLGK